MNETEFDQAITRATTSLVDTFTLARGPCDTCGGTKRVLNADASDGGPDLYIDCRACSDGLGPLLVLTALGGEPHYYTPTDATKNVWRFPVASTNKETT